MTDKLEIKESDLLIKKSDLLITKNTIEKIRDYLGCNGLVKLSFNTTIQAVDLILQKEYLEQRRKQCLKSK